MSSSHILFYYILPILALSVAVYALFSSIYTVRVQQPKQDFLPAIYRMIIEKPYLSAIYDIDKDKFSNPPKGMTPEEFKGSMMAFCYLYLRSFEMVFWDRVFKQTRGKRTEEKRIWENRVIHLMVSSTLFRQIKEKEMDGNRYNPWFRARMKIFLIIAEQLIPLFEKQKAGGITQLEYYDVSKELLEKASITF
jgi:hypothetical protein